MEKQTVSVSVWALRGPELFEEGRACLDLTVHSLPLFGALQGFHVQVAPDSLWAGPRSGRGGPVEGQGPFQPLLNPPHLCVPCRWVADQAGLLLHRTTQSCQSALLRPLRQGEPPGRTPGRRRKLLVPMPLPPCSQLSSPSVPALARAPPPPTCPCLPPESPTCVAIKTPTDFRVGRNRRRC